MYLTRKLFILGSVIGILFLVPSCSPEKAGEDGKPEDTAGQDTRRLYLRVKGNTSVDYSAKIVRVNGIEYTPSEDKDAGKWFVDVEESPFGVYSAELVEASSPSWYGEMPTKDILIPSVQFLGKAGELDAIPLFASWDGSLGNYLDFSAPYAVLDLVLSGWDGTPVSLKLSSSSSLCGRVSWNRGSQAFVYGEGAREVVLNCTEGEADGHYPIRVFGKDLKDAVLRVCDNSHRMFEVPLQDVELAPGMLKTLKLTGCPEEGSLWFEGFDLCVWGGDPVNGRAGVSPVSHVMDLKGDGTLSGYEYPAFVADAGTPGSGYIQYSFSDEEGTVSEQHEMSGSYIRSRGFDSYMNMLRCRECPGYISVGTGSTGRGIFAMYPLEGIASVKNLEVTFRICPDAACTDDLLFQVTGSSSVIRFWSVDGVEKGEEFLSQKRTTATLTLDKTALGSGWKTVKVLIDNCTDATVLKWLAATSEAGQHGFYLDEISVKEIPGSWSSSNRLRILYWNIQNGMWFDQYGYDNFVAFVKRYSPDICVWCEAKTNYESASDTWIDIDAPSFLPDNWPQLAARYGHSYVGVSRRDKEAFPQVVTSRFPVEKLLQLDYIPGEEPIYHGAGLFRVETGAGSYYIVTLHLNPYADEDAERRREVGHILDATVRDSRWPAQRGWLVMGDFNSHSRMDAEFLSFEEDSPKYAAHDYILRETALMDLMGNRYPASYVSTTYGYSRFDYVYMDAATYGRVRDAGVVTTQWNAPVFSGISNFYYPSDHRPLLVDIDY